MRILTLLVAILVIALVVSGVIYFRSTNDTAEIVIDKRKLEEKARETEKEIHETFQHEHDEHEHEHQHETPPAVPQEEQRVP